MSLKPYHSSSLNDLSLTLDSGFNPSTTTGSWPMSDELPNWILDVEGFDLRVEPFVILIRRHFMKNTRLKQWNSRSED